MMHQHRRGANPLFAFLSFTALACPALGDQADLIVHNAKVVTVDLDFHIASAMAIAGERILAVGQDDEIMRLASSDTKKIDLSGKVVLPGLIDSHVHPSGASLYEFDHPVPRMGSVAEVLDYVEQRARALEEGRWIVVQQVFITRLADRRFPTRDELDLAAPNHPVYFRTGPDGVLNSAGLKRTGVDKNYRIPAGKSGKIERDPATGEPTGVIRGASSYLDIGDTNRAPSDEDRRKRLQELLRDYNSVGITSISDRNATDQAVTTYQELRKRDELSCRVFVYYAVDANAPIDEIKKKITHAAQHPLHEKNNQLWLRGIKVFLDGGMLTGSAYMRKPWGVSKIYSITDPKYQGTLKIPPERLYQITKLALENNLQMTAHSVGDGAVHALIDAYEAVNQVIPVREARPCITHSNFMSLEAIQRMRRLGIVADLQPAWLWMDGVTLRQHFGDERMEYFQPYRTLFDHEVVVGGGSDHMQKIGSMRSINPYNPFLGMWIALARVPRGSQMPIHPGQSISREDAIRLYTINNAFLTFEEHEKGSLEPGKLADFIVLDGDILSCPLQQIRRIEVEQTYVGGQLVYPR